MSELISSKEDFSRWVVTHPDNLDITAYEENIMLDAWQAAKAQATIEIDDLKAQLKAVHESRAEFVQYCNVSESSTQKNIRYK